MSVANTIRRLTAPQIKGMKGDAKVVALTAYSTPIAKAFDAHCDMILVGDSVGMVLYGMESTLGVTVDMMIAHGQAVMRGSQRALVVVDMPFGSYEGSPEQAFATASRIMGETGCSAVKMEGGAEMAETIRFLTSRGVPVMAHVGLTPQSVNTIGGYKVVGRGAEADAVIADARAVTEAGAFALVLEKIPTELAEEITKEVAAPTIGIGASNLCDGQILVSDDVIGLFTDFLPKFAKRYAEVAQDIEQAAEDYARDVRDGSFPAAEHSYKG